MTDTNQEKATFGARNRRLYAFSRGLVFQKHDKDFSFYCYKSSPDYQDDGYRVPLYPQWPGALRKNEPVGARKQILFTLARHEKVRGVLAHIFTSGAKLGSGKVQAPVVSPASKKVGNRKRFFMFYQPRTKNKEEASGPHVNTCKLRQLPKSVDGEQFNGWLQLIKNKKLAAVIPLYEEVNRTQDCPASEMFWRCFQVDLHDTPRQEEHWSNGLESFLARIFKHGLKWNGKYPRSD